MNNHHYIVLKTISEAKFFIMLITK